MSRLMEVSQKIDDLLVVNSEVKVYFSWYNLQSQVVRFEV